MVVKDIPLVKATDNQTQSNFHDLRSKHIDLDWSVDWSNQLISGSATHTLVAQHSAVYQAQFDTSYLLIKRITNALTSQELEYTVSPRHPVLGSKLTVILAEPVKDGDEVKVKVEYETTKQCTALGWLEKQQTGSGKFPFLFSQCQAIHARSLLPCQDTPSIKSTYSAIVSSPLPILMSARLVSAATSTASIDMNKPQTFKFDQPVAIPSYLIAISGGELEFRELGERTGVWDEPGRVEASKWEFERDTERFVKATEDVTCPYQWGRYDVLVLPSSFPYGGMENANMTFLTPALVVGDRTEVDVIAHEIAHSWFGNLIGCANWDSFWLNEGWTTYTERLVARSLHGEPTRAFEFIVGNKGLNDELARHQSHPKYQRMHIPYTFGEDPDAAFGSIPYDKGSQFLLYLERVVGGLKFFMPYMKAYVARFAGLSITTEDWLNHFHAYWNEADHPTQHEALKAVDFDAWINGEGLYLPVDMKFDTSLADAAYALAERWDKERSATKGKFGKKDIGEFSANQVSLFLDTVVGYPAFARDAIDEMEAVYAFNESGNPEIKLRWYSLALKGGLYTVEAAKWVETAGRMKYCRPIYKAINRVDPALAKKTFLESGVHFLHPIAKRMIAQDLGIDA